MLSIGSICPVLLYMEIPHTTGIYRDPAQHAIAAGYVLDAELWAYPMGYGTSHGISHGIIVMYYLVQYISNKIFSPGSELGRSNGACAVCTGQPNIYILVAKVFLSIYSQSDQV